MISFDPMKSITLSSTTTWETVDLSSGFDVPSNATGIIIEVTNSSSETSVGARKYGSSDNRTNNTRGNDTTFCFIGLNTSRQFEFYRGTSTITIKLTGYFTSDAVFFTNSPGNKGVSVNGWQNLDCRPNVPYGAKALIFEIIGTDAVSSQIGLRNSGSTDTTYGSPRISHTFGLIGCQNQISQGMCLSTGVCQYWLIGYLTEGSFKVNSVLKNPSSSNVWEDKDLTGDADMPAGRSGVHMVINTSGNSVGVRINGSTDDSWLHYIYNLTYASIGIDIDDIIEVRSNGGSIYLNGFFVNPEEDGYVHSKTRNLVLRNTDITALTLEEMEDDAGLIHEEAQGWTVDKRASPNFCPYKPDTTQANSAPPFTTTEPTAFSQLGYRSQSTYTGRFVAGNWLLRFSVKNNTYVAQTGVVKFRLWRSTNASGSGATQITSGWQASTTLSWSVANTYTGATITVALSAIDLNGEYLFMEVEWSCSVSGGNNSAAVDWVHDTRLSKLTTPIFLPAKLYSGSITLNLLNSYTSTTPLLYTGAQTLYLNPQGQWTIAEVNERGQVCFFHAKQELVMEFGSKLHPSRVIDESGVVMGRVRPQLILYEGAISYSLQPASTYANYPPAFFQYQGDITLSLTPTSTYSPHWEKAGDVSFSLTPNSLYEYGFFYGGDIQLSLLPSATYLAIHSYNGSVTLSLIPQSTYSPGWSYTGATSLSLLPQASYGPEWALIGGISVEVIPNSSYFRDFIYQGFISLEIIPISSYLFVPIYFYTGDVALSLLPASNHFGDYVYYGALLTSLLPTSPYFSDYVFVGNQFLNFILQSTFVPQWTITGAIDVTLLPGADYKQDFYLIGDVLVRLLPESTHLANYIYFGLVQFLLGLSDVDAQEPIESFFFDSIESGSMPLPPQGVYPYPVIETKAPPTPTETIVWIETEERVK